MDTQELKIRAKKISALDDFENNLDLTKSYVIIGYRNGDDGRNFKMPLSTLISYISQNASNGITDANLLSKINNLISTNQISIPVTAGPQGPQGPQGAGSNITGADIDDLYRRIEDLQQQINRYHNSFSIIYDLENVNVTDNPVVRSIRHGENYILNFSPAQGYRMPNSIRVTGCSNYNYNASAKTLFIGEPTDNITITISAMKNNYFINYNLQNISYSIIENYKLSYQIGDTFKLSLTASNGYILPDNINVSNCLVTSYILNGNGNIVTASIKCLGTGDMTISASAISESTYYFGYFTDDDTDVNVTYEYYPNTDELKNLGSVIINSTSKLSSSTSCPFNVNNSLIFQNIGNSISVTKNVIIIVPKKYATITVTGGRTMVKFKTNDNTEYELYPKNFQFTSLSFPYNCETTIGGIGYYALLIEDQFNGAEYIFKN